MTHVACAICAPGSGDLRPKIIEEIARVTRSTPVILAADEAVEFALKDVDNEDIKTTLEQIVLGYAIDIAIVPNQHRRKRVLLSDMDSTMITIECVDELAAVAGVKEEVAAITRRAMAGKIDFQQAMADRVRLLEGLPVAAVETVFNESLSLMPGAKTLVRTMRAAGCQTMLISGGFTLFTERVAAMIGFESHRGNRLEVVDDHLTGRLIHPIGGELTKLTVLRELVSKLDIGPEQVLAVGDGANDRSMIQAAGLGAAFRAKPVLMKVADVAINHADLSALLYVQGYSSEELVR